MEMDKKKFEVLKNINKEIKRKLKENDIDVGEVEVVEKQQQQENVRNQIEIGEFKIGSSVADLKILEDTISRLIIKFKNKKSISYIG